MTLFNVHVIYLLTYMNGTGRRKMIQRPRGHIYLYTESNMRHGVLVASDGSPLQLNVECHMVL